MQEQVLAGAAPDAVATRRRHAAATLRLAAPLALAQLAQMGMAVTDTVLLGSLGGAALAAGGLGAGLFFTIMILLQGVLSAISAMVAQARGAGRPERVPAIYWTGLMLALALSVPGILALGWVEPLLAALGEPAGLAHDVARYDRVLRWAAPATLVGMGVMRAFLPAIERPRLILWATLGAVAVNGVLNYGLIHGAWGLPRLGLLGSATASAITLTGSAVALLALLHGNPALRRFVRPVGIRAAELAELLRLGWPIGVTYGVELVLFQVAGLLAGLLGTASLAAHQMVLNVAATTFMVPFGVGQAASVRVGYWAGAGRPAEARRAGLVALALGAGFMACTALAMIAVPRGIIGLYLDLADPGNAGTIAIAERLLLVAALFQVVDGVQAIAAGGLRGLKDTRVPMLLAAAGYWAVGFPVGYGLGFPAGLGAPGIWCGLALGLAAVALLLTLRFEARTR